MKIKILCACFVFLAMCCCDKAYGYIKTGNVVTIQKGDTLWDIAANEFGDGQRCRQLAKLNKIKNPKKLRIGTRIFLRLQPITQQSANTANITKTKITDTTTNHPEEKKDVAPLNINEENNITPPNITEKEEEAQTAETTTELTEPQPEIKSENSGNSAKLSYWQKYNIHGFLANETAYSCTLTKMKNIFFVGKEGKMTDDIGYKISGRAYYDAVFDLNSKYNKNVERDQKTEFELRNTYIDISAWNFDGRVGWQQIVWGEAIGNLSPANILTSLDLREFILPWSVEQYSIPIFAFLGERYFNKTHLEAIFIPFPKFHRLALEGAEFAFPRSAEINGIPIRYSEPEKPANKLKNSEIGFRASHQIKGYDLTLFYLYGWNRFPTNYRDINLDEKYNPIVTVKPRYNRLNTIGMAGTKSLDIGNGKDIVGRGEFAYKRKGMYSVNDISDQDGVINKDYIEWLLSFSYTLFKKVDTTWQLQQRYIINYDPRMIDKKLDTSFSIWLKTGFSDNMWEPELTWITSLNMRDSILRPRLNINFSRFKLAFGADIFGGDPGGLFSQFKGHSRVYSELTFPF